MSFIATQGPSLSVLPDSTGGGSGDNTLDFSPVDFAIKSGSLGVQSNNWATGQHYYTQRATSILGVRALAYRSAVGETITVRVWDVLTGADISAGGAVSAALPVAGYQSVSVLFAASIALAANSLIALSSKSSGNQTPFVNNGSYWWWSIPIGPNWMQLAGQPGWYALAGGDTIPNQPWGVWSPHEPIL